MTDHQQAAIEAAAKQHSPHLWDEQFRDSLLRLRGLTPEIADEAVEKRRAEILAEAEEYITAAEPHLRRKWAEGVVCLCGSTRFRAEIVEANRLLTLEGHIVLAPGVFGHDGDPITDDEKAKLDALHLRKIDMAKQVIVIAPEGYIGESTRREIVYAESTGKPVIIWKQITLEGAGE